MDYSNPYGDNNNATSNTDGQTNPYQQDNHNQQQQNSYDQQNQQQYNHQYDQSQQQQYYDNGQQQQQPAYNQQQQQQQMPQQPMQQQQQQNQQPQTPTQQPKPTQGIIPSFSYKPHNDGFMELKVGEAMIYKDTLGKHHKYSIVGRDSIGDIEIQRRFSEFNKFREVLVRNYIGLYIPPLPAKQTLNKTDHQLTKERQYFLNLFCQQCCNLRYLVSSYELQVFLRPQGKCDEAMSRIVRPTTNDILGVYRATCPINENIADREIVFYNGEITTFARSQNDLIGTLKRFKTVIKNIFPLKEQENEYYKHFAEFLTKYEETHQRSANGADMSSIRLTGEQSKLTERLQTLSQTQTNPYTHTRNWVKGEIYALKAVLSAIDAKDNIEKQKQRAGSTLQDKRETQEKLKQGKFTFKGLLKNQSEKEASAESMTASIKQLEEDLVNYDEMKNYVIVHLYTDALPDFKKKRVENYLKSMELLSSDELKNAVQAQDSWYELQQKLEVYKL